MKFVDEFREPEVISRTAAEIRRLADPNRHYRIMEVCGGHTHAIYRFGLKDLLPSNIELIHGPGCPVCVLPMGRIDDGLAIAQDPQVIFAAFGAAAIGFFSNLPMAFAGGLLIGFHLPETSKLAAATSADPKLNAFVRVGADDSVTLTIHRAELGIGHHEIRRPSHFRLILDVQFV